ncbi:MAG: NAD(P)H-dependent oxidoreductase [Gemmatimonadota bacterium]|jgi:hypothetical protein
MVPLPFPSRRRALRVDHAVQPRRATILNGALAGDTELDRLHDELSDALTAMGHVVQSFQLRDIPLAYCRGCFECWTRTPGICHTKDDGPTIAEAIIGSDITAWLSTVTFGGYASELKKAVDRINGLVSPFFTRRRGRVRHRRRYDRYPFLLVFGVLPEPDPEQERIFRALAECNAINLHAPGHAVEIVYRGHDPRDVWAGLERLAERRVA